MPLRIQAGESAVADEDCGYADEGEEVFGLALVAAVEPSAAGQPGHGSLDHPAMSAQPLRGLDALAGDARRDVPRAEPSTQVAVVVPLTAVALGGRRRRGPRRELTGGMPRTSGSSPWLSWVLAAETPVERGRPVAALPARGAAARLAVGRFPLPPIESLRSSEFPRLGSRQYFSSSCSIRSPTPQRGWGGGRVRPNLHPLAFPRRPMSYPHPTTSPPLTQNS